MLGRYLFIGACAVGVLAIMKAHADSRESSATVSQSCSQAVPGAAFVTFVWRPVAQTQEVWLDVGLTKEFAPGTFTGHGPLAPDQTAYAVDGIPAGVRLQYRVHALVDAEWRKTASGAFTSECDADG